MIQWTPFAFLRIGAFLILGILFGIFSNTHSDFWEHLCLLGIILYFSVFISSSQIFRRKYHVVFGFFAMLILFLFGITRVNQKMEILDKQHFSHQDSVKYYQAVVISSPIEKENSWQVEAEVQKVLADTVWKKAKGKILIYFQKTDSFSATYGSVFVAKDCPKMVEPNKNPEAFDFKKYLSYQQIYHQQYLNKDAYQITEKIIPNYLIYSSLLVRNYCDQQLKTYIHSSEEYGIATALLLGVKDHLDGEIKTAYSETGTMHVLAVSGLHVGILFAIFAFIFAPLKRKSAWLFAGIVIAFLWFYAFITGLSPSVLRAVGMFSLFVLAEAMQKKRNFYNTLGISACVILAYDPFLLLSVSFQLSYLAVIGIVFFHPKIYLLYTPKNRFFDYVWQLFCLSMAAQISTFPISLYYFHQFPMYFWLANLVVVPAATFMLQGSLLVVLTSFLPFLPNIFGFLTEKLIFFNNFFVKFIQNLPFSVLEGINISLPETLLMYLAMIFLILLFYLKEFKYALAVFACVICISFLQISKFFEQSKQSFFTIFDLQKAPNLQFLQADKAIFISDLNSEDKKIKNNLQNFWVKKGVSHVIFAHFKENSDEILTYSGKNYELFIKNGKKFLLIKERQNKQYYPDSDFVIVSKNAVKKLSDLGATQFKMLIIDASNSLYYAQKLKKEADSMQITCHSVHEQGALVKDF